MAHELTSSGLTSPFPDKEQLLKNDPVERLPMKPGGASCLQVYAGVRLQFAEVATHTAKVQNIKQHKWFSDFDWEAAESIGRNWPPETPNPIG